MARHVVEDFHCLSREGQAVICVPAPFEWPARCRGYFSPAGLVVKSGNDEYLFPGVVADLAHGSEVAVAHLAGTTVQEGWMVSVPPTAAAA